MSNEMDELFGTPKYGASSGGQRNHKIEPGHNLYRFGPPWKSLAASGKWNQYCAVHFGYQGVNRTDPSKTSARTFLCPQEKDRRTKMIKVGCRECDRIAAQEALRDTRMAQLKAEGKSDDVIEKHPTVEPIVAWLKAHNLSKKYNTIAKNDKGEWGILPLGHKTKQQLEAKIAQLMNEDGLSALAAKDGVWFDIIRSGEKWNTTYDVQVVMETQMVDNKRVKLVKTDTMTQKDVEDIKANCPDLTTIGVRLSQEQISQLAASNGDPEDVDNIFNQGQVERSKSRSAAQARTPAPAPAPAPVATPAPVVAAPAPVQAAPTPAAPAVDPTVAALMQQIAQMQAMLAAATRPAPVGATPGVDNQGNATPAPGFTTVTPAPAPTPAPTPAPVVAKENLDDAEFVRLFGKVS